MNKTLSITVKGNEKEWVFTFQGDPKHITQWREDGLEVDVILNTVPEWVARFRLVSPWCFIQDIFNFNNPFK